MKVLTATNLTQGHRRSDFCFTDYGELLVFGFICDSERNGNNPDGGCGCLRSLSGMISHKATTTFRVEDRNLTEKKFINLYLASMQEAGILVGKNHSLIRDLTNDAKLLLEYADRFEVGEVVEKRGAKFQARKVKLNPIMA